MGIANIADNNAPSRALRFYPFHGDALANQAFNTLQGGRPADVARAEELARRAFYRDPTSVAAVRTLGLIQDVRGKRNRASRVLGHALALNRRDLVTHLWLIEYNVQRGDAVGALRHYDMALRTSAAAHPILMPILIEASSDPGIRAPLTQFLAKRPAWASTFIREIIAKADPVDAAVDLERRLGRAGAPFSAQQDEDLAVRLVAEERFVTAAQLMNRNADPATVIDPGFDFRKRAGVFSWALQSTYSLGAGEDLATSNQADHVLSIFSAPGQGGEVARQLLMLKPGRYRISSTANGLTLVPPDQGRWVVSCAGRNGRDIVTLNLLGGSGSQTGANAFEVPDLGCVAQWIALVLKAPADTGIQGQVEKVEITPLR
ncbi:hypothetical protein E5A73_18320 [Sphingomonas gei]|uniref:Tetratricopeptide repeat protein n=1 Tax=Sphingomonas gei TaxID=1395960 RepID=A0A4S1X7B0_9SPHN|nr:hypothetical protein [Sphingomonas gei]TGX50366.1 hypothetical protein E5A73_18320 [Sphingomonas gei]